MRLGRDVAQSCQRIGGFTGLADEDCQRVGTNGWSAVAELGRNIDLDWDAREFFDPVFCRRASKIGRAAGDHENAVDLGKVWGVGRQVQRVFGHVVFDGVGKNTWLFGDFLGHEVLVAAFFYA